MEKQNSEPSGNRHYEALFRHALGEVFRGMQQKEHAIVCMKCLRFVQVGDVPNKCCKRFGFIVDPKSVVVDSATGRVTHAAPAVKRET